MKLTESTNKTVNCITRYISGVGTYRIELNKVFIFKNVYPFMLIAINFFFGIKGQICGGYPWETG